MNETRASRKPGHFWGALQSQPSLSSAPAEKDKKGKRTVLSGTASAEATEAGKPSARTPLPWARCLVKGPPHSRPLERGRCPRPTPNPGPGFGTAFWTHLGLPIALGQLECGGPTGPWGVDGTLAGGAS